MSLESFTSNFDPFSSDQDSDSSQSGRQDNEQGADQDSRQGAGSQNKVEGESGDGGDGGRGGSADGGDASGGSIGGFEGDGVNIDLGDDTAFGGVGGDGGDASADGGDSGDVSPDIRSDIDQDSGLANRFDSEQFQDQDSETNLESDSGLEVGGFDFKDIDAF